jgi:hypothetical protein
VRQTWLSLLDNSENPSWKVKRGKSFFCRKRQMNVEKVDEIFRDGSNASINEIIQF